MLKLYEFYLDYGRSGDISGLFVADEQDVASAIGKYIYLGEVLGKHSDVSFDLEEDMLTEYFKNDPEKNALAVSLFGEGTISGCNPLSYIKETETEEDGE